MTCGWLWSEGKSPLGCCHGDGDGEVMVADAGMFNCAEIPSGCLQHG